MSNLKHWQAKIREKRKKTPFKEFLKELGSWYPVVFNKNSGMISRYPESDRISICSLKEFEDSRDDLVKNGFDYDFETDFFSNFSKLFKSIKLPNFITYGVNQNCDYADSPADVNNVYLSSVVVLGSENVFYSNVIRSNVVNCFNSLYVVENSENIYFSTCIITSFNIFYSKYLNNCSNIWFSSNLTGCRECLFCNDLENISYYIYNKKYEKEEYFRKKEEILKQKDKFLDYYKKLDKSGKNHGSTNTIGNFILDSEDIENGNFIYNTKNARNVIFAGSETGNSNVFDGITCGGGGGDDMYGVINSGGQPTHLYMVAHSGWCSNIHYCFMLENCSFCIGCIGLRNKSYCILNKQYSKDDWEILADKIFEQMDKDKILGNFFPATMSPFYFNDTIAGIFGNFSKDEVKKDGYMWRDSEIKVDVPEGSDLIDISDLKDFEGFDENGKWMINPEILNKVIKDQKGNYYRIIKAEYDFLMKYGLPIPEIHWADRLKLNFGI